MRSYPRPISRSLAVTLSLLSACTTYAPARPTDLRLTHQVRATFAAPRDLQIHYGADSMETWRTTRIDGQFAGGSPDSMRLMRQDPNDRTKSGTVTFAVDSGTAMQTRRFSAGKTALLILGAGVVAVGTVGVIVLSTDCLVFCPRQ